MEIGQKLIVGGLVLGLAAGITLLATRGTKEERENLPPTPTPGTGSYQLIISDQPGGTGMVKVTPRKSSYFYGEAVDFQAFPNSGYKFNWWLLNGQWLDSWPSIRLAIMDNPTYLTAVFEMLPGSYL